MQNYSIDYGKGYHKWLSFIRVANSLIASYLSFDVCFCYIIHYKPLMDVSINANKPLLSCINGWLFKMKSPLRNINPAQDKDRPDQGDHRDDFVDHDGGSD